MHGEEVHAWQRGACVVKGVCMAKGGVHGKGGMCVAKGGVHGERTHA